MKTRLGIIGLLVIFMIMVACTSNVNNIDTPTSQIPAAGSTQNPATKEGPYRFGLVHYPPLGIIDKGEFKGPGVEIMKLTFERMGLKEGEYEFVELPWNRILEMVKAGDLTGVIDVAKTDERETYMDYSAVPYALYHQTVVVLKGQEVTYDGSLQSLNPYTLGVVNGYFIAEDFEDKVQAGDYKVEFALTSEDNVDKLLEGRVQCIIDDQYVIQDYLLSIGRKDEVMFLVPSYNTFITYVGFSKKLGLDDLINDFNEALKSIREDGTYDMILNKYLE